MRSQPLSFAKTGKPSFIFPVLQNSLSGILGQKAEDDAQMTQTFGILPRKPTLSVISMILEAACLRLLQTQAMFIPSQGSDGLED